MVTDESRELQVDELVGHDLVGRWRIDRVVFGSPDEGLYRVVDVHDPAVAASASIVRVSPTVSDRGRDVVSSVREGLGIVPLIETGMLDAPPLGRLTFVIEAIDPVGALAAPLGRVRALAAAINLCAHIERWDATEPALGGVHPAIVHADGNVLAPRSALLFQATAGGSQGRIPAFPHTFAAPEVLEGGPAQRASAVYSIAACAIWWVRGVHPIEGDGWRQLLLMSSINAVRRDLDLPLREALAARPADRPSVAELLSMLEALREG